MLGLGAPDELQDTDNPDWAPRKVSEAARDEEAVLEEGIAISANIFLQVCSIVVLTT